MYEICTDIIQENDDALLIDTEKHVGIRIGSIGAEMLHAPKYIIIPVASGLKVYISMPNIRIILKETSHE